VYSSSTLHRQSGSRNANTFPQFWIPISAVTLGVLTKGKTIDGENSAFAATVKGKGKTTDRVVIFERVRSRGWLGLSLSLWVSLIEKKKKGGSVVLAMSSADERHLDSWFEEDA